MIVMDRPRRLPDGRLTAHLLSDKAGDDGYFELLPIAVSLGCFPVFLQYRGSYKAGWDKLREETLVRQSNLDWTIIRPGAFIDGPLTGQYRYGFSGTDRTTKLKISRADVADFILKQLSDQSSVYQAPSLSY